MLILKSENVQYCHLSHQEESATTSFPGLSYRGHLFVQVESYPLNQSLNAISHCREFLDRQVPVMSIIVKEATRLTLWSKNESVSLVKNTTSSVATPQSSSNKQQKARVKYRGVEITRQKKILLSPSQIVKNSKLKYRGQSY